LAMFVLHELLYIKVKAQKLCYYNTAWNNLTHSKKQKMYDLRIC